MKGKMMKSESPMKGDRDMDPPPSQVYAGGGSNVVKEAKERKRGGRVKEMKMEGKMSKMRLDRPGRKRGGRVGSDMAPLTSAAKVMPTTGHSADGDL